MTPAHPLPSPRRRFQILSLDGGGIRGILAAGILAKLEDDLQTRIADHFDLIAGTSTGGIIAIGLGLGLRPRDILDFYLQEGPRIFPSWYGLKGLQHWFTRKYSSGPLETALRQCFGERRFGESSKRLLIPAYNVGDDDVYIFRTPHLERLKRDFKVPAWQVARATSAAPTFFPCARDVDKLRLVDGGVWANNPAMVALVEVVGERNLNVPLSDVYVLSIGTSNPVNDRKARLNSGGVLAWGREGAAVDVIMRGQSLAVNNQLRFLLGEERFTRIDPPVPAGRFSLDGIKTVDDLVAKAAHHSRVFTPSFNATFAGHMAEPFTPFHNLTVREPLC